MVLKAVLLEFSGVLIRDADLQKNLIDEILIAENLRPDPVEFSQICLGRSDRTCLKQLLQCRGRVVSDAYLDKLLAQKSNAYTEALASRPRLPLYSGLEDFLYQLKAASLNIGLVTVASKTEVDWVLSNANLNIPFTLVVTGEELAAEECKPCPKIYEIALSRLQQSFGTISAHECLAIEASFSGITAAKQAQIPVVGVAHLYPYRMMQRRANWAVDYLHEIEIDWIRRQYDAETYALT